MSKQRNGMSESESGKLGALKTKQFYKEKKEKQKEEYYLNPKYCLTCGNVIPFEKRNNKCCCRSCATIYGNKYSWEGNIYYLRSSYEEIYANELDNNKIKYDYENLRIKYWHSQKQEFRTAILDFYLINKNMIVEIKSIYTLDLQNMKDKKKSYLENGYKFKCICDFKEIKI